MRAADPRLIPRLVLPATVIVLVILCGAAGYRLIEGWSALDSLYMSVITVTTVGLREVRELDMPGRVFTIILVVFGVGAYMYTTSSVANYLITGELRGHLEKRKMDSKIRHVSNHYIICGYGRMGVQVAREFLREGKPIVVIEKSDELVARALEGGYLALHGDAGDDNMLEEAGIRRARGLVSAIDDDATNVLVVLSARTLNEKMFIVARANTEMTESKLVAAGANRVIWPSGLAGRRLAQMALRPNVVEFLEVVMHDEELELWLEEFKVAIESRLDGIEIDDASIRSETGANVVALRQHTGKLIATVKPGTRLQAGDILVAVGTREQLALLQQMSRT